MGRTTAHSPSFGVLGRTTPGKVRTGRTVGDYSSALGPPALAEVEIMHLRTNHIAS